MEIAKILCNSANISNTSHLEIKLNKIQSNDISYVVRTQSPHRVNDSLISTNHKAGLSPTEEAPHDSFCRNTILMKRKL